MSIKSTIVPFKKKSPLGLLVYKLIYFGAKRNQGQNGKFEALFSKGDADNRYAKNQTNNKIH